MWVSWESDVITVISYSPLGDCAVSHIPLYKGNVNGKSTVVYDEVPNPCYNEYICYISPLLCLRGRKLQQRLLRQSDVRVIAPKSYHSSGPIEASNSFRVHDQWRLEVLAPA